MKKLPPLTCSLPHCSRKVGYHKAHKNGTHQNKQVCNYHRKAGKHEVDAWKMSQGCANKDAHYGFACVSMDILHPATLDINHIDGNNLNRNPENIEVLCKMCHTVVTIQEGHHTKIGPRKWPKNPLFDELFHFVNDDE
jgi:5-methylcytosine-specific restriction endonuclease McrA